MGIVVTDHDQHTFPRGALEETGSFIALRGRKRLVEQLADGQARALQKFHYGDDLAAASRVRIRIAGFALHPIVDPPAEPHLSISSATTCVRSLLASSAIGDRADFSPVLNALEERNRERKLTTGDLPNNNPYTLGQLLPTLRRMVTDSARPTLVDDAVTALEQVLGNDGVSIDDFPANGFLTWWALVAVASWGELDLAKCAPSLDWSEQELYRQLSLFTAEDDEADVYQLGYNLLIQRRFRRDKTKDSVVAAGLRALFGAQLKTGIWEKKEPLFTYKTSSDAYPFAFELINAVLTEFQDSQAFLIEHEPALDQAVGWAERNAYQTDDPMWRSGHVADNADPESWATAEVYFFLQNYQSYLARRILALVLRETRRGRRAHRPNSSSFTGLYQPTVKLDDEEPLVGDLIRTRMLEPLKLADGPEQRYSLARNPERNSLVRSGIFFGPPGTGKTTYARAIAEYLGWPLLTITPADFAAEGMLLIPTVARRIFDRLVELEDVVIFFDEMEELMHTRDDGAGTFEQRFLTTSFLPSLQDLRDNATCIYLVATNKVQSLDPAARAPRRFDFQFQVRPPAFAEKLRMLASDFPAADTEETRLELNREKEKVEWATLRETRDLFRRIEAGAAPRDAVAALAPSLRDEAAELDEDAKNNSFGAAA
jgi:ATPase family associated with various cellular activities (AAA)